MCGNFGLILLGRRNKDKDGPADPNGSTSGVVVVVVVAGDVKGANRAASAASAASTAKPTESDYIKNQSTDAKDVTFQLDNTVKTSSTTTSSSTSSSSSVLRPSNKDLASVLDILRSQTAATEIRGGQAGGFSVIGN